MTTRGLTHKQIRWVEEYAVHGNGTEAARRAGYSQRSLKGLGVQAVQNLAKPRVKAALGQEIQRLRADYGPERVKRRLHELSHGSEAAGQFGPATRCEELLGKAAGMWVDQTIALSGQLKDEHIQALIELARQRQQQPIDLTDDDTHNQDTHSDE